MTTAIKIAEISRRILARKADGLSTCDAIDAVLGPGTTDRVIGEVWEAMTSTANLIDASISARRSGDDDGAIRLMRVAMARPDADAALADRYTMKPRKIA
jgi:hypothetical protein